MAEKSLVSTPGLTYYGCDANTEKALSVSYYGNTLKIAIHNLASAGSSTKFNYREGVEIYLDAKKVKKFIRLYKKCFKAAVNGEDFEAVGVASGSKLIELVPASKIGCVGDIAFIIYNDIDSETFKAGSSDQFAFVYDTYVKSFGDKGAEYTKQVINTDSDYFFDQLVEFSKAMTGAVAHSVRKECKFEMDRYLANQKLTMEKLGVEFQTTKSLSVNWSNGGSKSTSNRSNYVSEIDTQDILDSIE